MSNKNNIKGIVIFIMTVPIFFSANSQDTAVYWSDSKGKEVTMIKSNLGYVAKRWKENNVWHVMNFSYPAKVLQLDGFYSDLDCRRREGLFINYYDNGMMKDSGIFVQNIREGKHYGWHDTGEPNFIENYKHDRLVDTSIAWYKNGQRSMITIADKDGTGLQEEYSNNGKLITRGHFLAGKKNGIWIFMDDNQITSQKIDYESDSAMVVTNYDEKGVENEGSSRNVERPAVFPDGLNGWRRFLERNLRYPEEAQRKGIQGVIRVSLIVDKDGSVTDYRVLGNPDKDLAREALRIMSISPKWIPAIQHNRKVTYRFVQTITFQL